MNMFSISTWISGKKSIIDVMCLVLLIGYSVFSLTTIASYELVGYDESYYASSALSYSRDGTFAVPLDFPRTQGENAAWHVLLNNVIQGEVFKNFGIGVVQLRILSVFSGLGVLLLMYGWIRRRTDSSFCGLLFCLLFMSDRALNFMMHTGRMDMRGLFFVLLSFLLFEQALTSAKWKYLGAVVAGVIMSLGCLMTLRYAFALVPCVFLPFVFYEGKKKNFLVALSVFGAVAVAFTGLVHLFAFGGVGELLAQFSGKAESAGFARHFGFSFYDNLLRQTYDIPKLLFFYFCAVALMSILGKKMRSDFFFSAYLMMTLGFLLLIKENGPYRVAFLPFVYAVFLILFSLTKKTWSRAVVISGVFVILVGNFAITTHRNFYLIVNSRALSRMYSTASSVFNEFIPEGETVISTTLNYLALEKNENLVLNRPWYHESSDRTALWLDQIMDEKAPGFYVGPELPVSISDILIVEKLVDLPYPKLVGPKWMVSRLGPQKSAIYKIVGYKQEKPQLKFN